MINKKRASFKKLLILLIILQAGLILTFAGNRLLVLLGFLSANNLDNTDVILAGFAAAFIIGLGLLAAELSMMRKLRIQNIEQSEMLTNIAELNMRLRAQRHDFLNHIQVVYGLVEIKEYAEAENYLSKVYGDIERLSFSMKTGDAAVNALLQAKAIACRNKDIEFCLDVRSNLSGINIESWELCRLLGNLLDNAIYAADNYSGVKQLFVSITATVSSFLFTVKNSGDKIPENISGKIYEPFFSTKGEKGEGMGLYIVRELVRKNGGEISMESNGQSTSFYVVLKRLAFDNSDAKMNDSRRGY